MPPTRRSSISKVAAASNRQSFPATINSSTKVTKDKVDTIMTRRKRQAKRRASHQEVGDKENASINVLQSPTPYWKVAKERGTTTPPETRSTKKRKCKGKQLNFSPPNENGNTNRAGVLLFSPPDQRKNRIREKQELERKEKNRDQRNQKARESGQLLVFSPTFRNPAFIPGGAKGADDFVDEEQAAKLNAEHEAEIARLEQEYTKQLQELEGTNSSLEEKIENLQLELKQMADKIHLEKKELTDQIQSLEENVSQLEQDNQAQSDAFKEEKKHLSEQIKMGNKQRKDIEGKLASYESTIHDLQEKLIQSQESLKALEEKMKEENDALQLQCQSLRESSTEKDTEFESMRQAEASMRSTIDHYEKKIDDMENVKLPESQRKLDETIEQLQQYQREAAEQDGAIKAFEVEIAELKAELENVRQAQDEERKNFQALNEETSKAYELITRSLSEKEKHIEILTDELEDAEQRLENEKKTSKEWSKKAGALKSEMESALHRSEAALSRKCQELEQTKAEVSAQKDQASGITLQLQNERDQQSQILAENKEASRENALLRQQLQALQAELQGAKSERDAAANAAATSREREQEMFLKLQNGDMVRRALHNRVMQLSGNIRVFIRVRPVLESEMKVSRDGDESPFSFPEIGSTAADSKLLHGVDDLTKNMLEVVEPPKDRGGLSERRKRWTFGFDNVFNSQHGQNDVWEATEPLIQSTIDGYNVCIFAYGQTGSGKTYTMLGDETNAGLLSRAIERLFQARDHILELSRGGSSVSISVELLEIYNEKVRDLLAAGERGSVDDKGLKVKANEAVGSTKMTVSSETEVSEILNRAQKLRCVKATSSNSESSRSHLLFTIHFTVTSKDGKVRTGKLNVCDLAGSERLGKSNANAVVGSSLLKETKHINTSLSVLSTVIQKLQAGDAVIPFRDSKLTHLLQNSLGGNSKTLAIVCCNPLRDHFHESLCSLRFADKVNRVDLKAVANVKV